MRSTYTGPATVFRHDKNGRTFYSVAECRKNSEGETLFGYKLVQFKKGVELADKTKIDIRNAWESFYLNQDGEAVFYVFIADFTLQQPQPQPTQYVQPGAYQQPSQTWAPGSISVGGIAQPPVRYPQNTVQQQFGMPPQYQQPAQQTWPPQPQQPQQPAQPDPADTFEQIDEEVPF